LHIRITTLLREAGWAVNHKRVERIWRREGLKVPQRQSRRPAYGWSTATSDESDPRHHTRNMAECLRETAAHLREDIVKVQDPRAQALFETTAEVLGGLERAFRDYEAGTERAWSR
jgi:hypothetical protein